MNLEPLPAFSDNYIWLIHDGHNAMVVDPGDAQPVLSALHAQGLQLTSILVTHHHADHVGGVDELRQATNAKVYGPAGESIPEPCEKLTEGETVNTLGLSFLVLDVPGHTAGHIAFYCADFDSSPLLFCGDTLFSGGCGRLFEGTPAQMLTSLDKFAILPGNTRVCCTHEYTLSNLRFARTVDPDNFTLRNYQEKCEGLRAQNLPTLPSSIETELQINPFMRSRHPDLVASAKKFDNTVKSETEVFAALRNWKNDFR